MRRKLSLIFLSATLFGAGVSLPASAAGDPEKGESQARICSACHFFKAGKNKTGPSLFGVVGRQAGTAEGYSFSDAYVDAGKKGLVWDEANLVEYLANPRQFMRDYLKNEDASSRMLTKVSNKEKRENIAAYLATLK